MASQPLLDHLSFESLDCRAACLSSPNRKEEHRLGRGSGYGALPEGSWLTMEPNIACRALEGRGLGHLLLIVFSWVGGSQAWDPPGGQECPWVGGIG